MSFSLQKASFWKRISAFMFDGMMMVVLSLAIMIGLHAILKIDAKIDRLEAYRVEYATELGFNLNITTEEYDAFTEDERNAYDELYLELNKRMQQDEEVMNLNASILTSISITVTVSLLIGTAIWYFVIPLFFKNGVTLGKKIFGLAVVRTNGVKVSNPVLFARSLIGFYAIETMFPLTLIFMTLFGSLGIVGLVTVGLFLVLQIFVLAYTKTNSSIHDLLTDTAVVDMASQQIFETQEERTEFDKAEGARKAAEAEGDKPVATGAFAPRPETAQATAEETETVIITTEANVEAVTAEIAEPAQEEEKESVPQTEEKPAEAVPVESEVKTEDAAQNAPSAQETQSPNDEERVETTAPQAE